MNMTLEQFLLTSNTRNTWGEEDAKELYYWWIEGRSNRCFTDDWVNPNRRSTTEKINNVYEGIK